MRYELRARTLDPELAKAPPRAAAVMADNATHVTSALAQTFSTGLIEWHRFPVTLPIDDIVAGLNAVQPTVLTVYASLLCPLVEEARQGRLRIRPLRILSGSEPLFPEIRAAVEDTWAVPVVNIYGTSEAGGNAVSCGLGPWLHLSDDLVITEFVDCAGDPVAAGQCSDKLYLTNLYNYALPLIRYEITDQLRRIDGVCPCGSVHQRIEDPLGRLDDVFYYGQLTVHPHVFRSVLGRERHIVEYQVHQTATGAEVAARWVGPVDFADIAAEIADGLARLGLADPEVNVRATDRLERQSSGKLKRFVPSAALSCMSQTQKEEQCRSI
jgi:phenylacetate-coenzyme A ligase PaaK-like adenylate-forming protein